MPPEEPSLAVAIAKLEVKLDAIIQEMTRFREDFGRQLEEKASKAVQLDHENRVRRLERWCLVAFGFLLAAELILGYYIQVNYK